MGLVFSPEAYRVDTTLLADEHEETRTPLVTVETLAKHAGRFGTEGVLEIAESFLSEADVERLGDEIADVPVIRPQHKRVSRSTRRVRQ